MSNLIPLPLQNPGPITGYILSNSSEEYLVDARSLSFGASALWSLYPGLARVFPTVRQARRYALRYGKPLSVMELYDVGDRYLVCFLDENQ